jgi:hypothetical protein
MSCSVGIGIYVFIPVPLANESFIKTISQRTQTFVHFFHPASPLALPMGRGVDCVIAGAPVRKKTYRNYKTRKHYHKLDFFLLLSQEYRRKMRNGVYTTSRFLISSITFSLPQFFLCVLFVQFGFAHFAGTFLVLPSQPLFILKIYTFHYLNL